MLHPVAFFMIFALACSVQAVTNDFPATWKHCKVPQSGDYKKNKCLMEAIDIAVKDLDDGGEETLGMGDIDPMYLKKLTVGQKNRKSPINFVIELKNIDLVGLSNAKVTSVSGKLSSPKNWNMKVEAYISKMAMIGGYNIDGQILVLPIVGSGNCNITFDKVQATGIVHGMPTIKDGQEYLKILNLTLTLETSRFYVELENLFNGDKTLGNAMNKVLNDNWNIIYQEFRPPVEKAMAKHFLRYSRVPFERFPFKDIFIVE